MTELMLVWEELTTLQQNLLLLVSAFFFIQGFGWANARLLGDEFLTSWNQGMAELLDVFTYYPEDVE